MACFFHRKEEAVANCKECGKSMCEDCSSVSGHKGLCPSCLLPKIEKKLVKAIFKKENKIEEKKEFESSKIVKIVSTILLCWTIIYPLKQISYFLNFNKNLAKFDKEIYKIENEIKELEELIETINSALNQGRKKEILSK